MFPCRYKAPRMHHSEDVCNYQPPCDSSVDIFLWLIDIIDIDEKKSSLNMFHSVKSAYLDSYHYLNHRTPGMLIDWTESMHFFCVLMKLFPLDVGCNVSWARDNNLLISDDLSKLEDLITALDVVSSRWAQLDKSDELKSYLDFLWSRCKYFCIHMFYHSEAGFMEHSDKRFKIMPKYINMMSSRYYWFNQYMRQQQVWFTDTVKSCLTDDEKKWCLSFLESNRARFIDQRQFRKDLGDLMWRRHVMHPGDKDIAEYAMRGDKLSFYSALYKRRPASLMKIYQDRFVYGNEWSGKSEDYVHLLTADFYFRSVYSFPFKKCCVCFEDIIHKHRKALQFPKCPIILDMDSNFQVLLPNKKIVRVEKFYEAFALFLKHVDRVGDFDFSDIKATVLKNRNGEVVMLYE